MGRARQVVRSKRLESHRHPVGMLSLFGRRASARLDMLMGFIRETGGALLPPAISGVGFYYLQSSTPTNQASNMQMSTPTNCLLVLVLASYFLCDTACSTALGLFASRLIAPLWQIFRERRQALDTNSTGRMRSVRQRLSSPCRIEKNDRPYRSVGISHNPPPYIPSLSTHCCI